MRKLLIVPILALLLFAASAKAEDNGTVYNYWKMNEGSGNFTADDMGNLPVLASDLYWGGVYDVRPTGWVSGYEGMAGYFDGYSGFFNESVICLPTNGTISAWANPAGPSPNYASGGGVIAAQIDVGGTSAFVIWYDYFGIPGNVTCAVNDVTGPTTYIPQNAWTMVTCKWNATGVFLYLNGTLTETAATQSPASCGDHFSIGNFYDGAWERHFNGTIDDVRVGEAFSDEQIAAYATEPYTPATTTTTTTIIPTYPIPLVTGTGIPGIIISAAILIGLIAFLFGGELKLTPTDVAKGLIAALIMISLIAALSGMW